MMQIHNIEFFKKETVQKIIDFQFEETKFYLKLQLWFYCIAFIGPYSITLISQDKHT